MPSGDDEVGAAVAALGAAILVDLPAVARAMTDRIVEAVPSYAAGAVADSVLFATCVENARAILESIGTTDSFPAARSRANGRSRADAGVALPDVMAAYRVGARVLWDRLSDEAVRKQAPAEVTIRAAGAMWLVLDVFTQEMTGGYRDEMAFRSVSDARAQAAIVSAILGGGLSAREAHEAVAMLRFPGDGPYAAIALRPASIDGSLQRELERTFRSAGVPSLWLLQYELVLGLVHVSTTASMGAVPELLRMPQVLAAGVSPPTDDLTGIAAAVRFARLSLRGASAAEPIVLFDDAPLSVAISASADVMPRIAETVLGDLGGLPPAYRATLLDTFSAWCDAGGSTTAAARTLFVHPNTVRHRLHRIETLTGRSIDDPRALAELVLAIGYARRT